MCLFYHTVPSFTSHKHHHFLWLLAHLCYLSPSSLRVCSGKPELPPAVTDMTQADFKLMIRSEIEQGLTERTAKNLVTQMESFQDEIQRSLISLSLLGEELWTQSYSVSEAEAVTRKVQDIENARTRIQPRLPRHDAPRRVLCHPAMLHSRKPQQCLCLRTQPLNTWPVIASSFRCFHLSP